MKKVSLGTLSVVLAVFLLGGCGGTQEGNDAGDAGDAGIDQCKVDDSQRRSTDTNGFCIKPCSGDEDCPDSVCNLSLDKCEQQEQTACSEAGDCSGGMECEPTWKIESEGRPKTGYICPQIDIDHYWFELQQSGSIIRVNLKNNAPMSQVDLCYDIFHGSEDARVGGLCDHNGMDGETDITGTHYLVYSGNYFIEVRDESGDEQDARAPYYLTISTMPDPDNYELDADNQRNNDVEHARAIGSDQGYISYLGDEDWFLVEVGQPNQLIELSLTNAGPSPVDLQYTLLKPDGTTPVNAGKDTNGMDAATSLSDALPLVETGTYYIRINDFDDDDSDIEVGYTLQVSLRANPDDYEPNNTPEAATGLLSGVQVCDGYISTRGDVDWYVIEAPGVNDTDNPAVLEVDLQTSSSSLGMAVDLLVADPRMDCVPGDDCSELELWSCGQNCTTAQCAHAQCPSHECWIDKGKCKGAEVCLDGGAAGYGCGIRSLIMHTDEWSETGNPNHLHTTAPMFGEKYYLFVRDYWSINHDADASYCLTVTVHPEPDVHEYNGIYNPYMTSEQEDDTRRWNRGLATEINCTEDAGTGEITCGPIVGYLSYRGDQDWYKLAVAGQGYFIPKLPEPGALPDDLNKNVDFDIRFDWTHEAGMAGDLTIGYVLPWPRDTAMGPEVVGPGTGSWGSGDVPGNGECSYYCGEFHAPVNDAYLWVFTPSFKSYDRLHSYSITITATPGCPQNCSYCWPGQNCWACPNPGNPNPDSSQCTDP